MKLTAALLPVSVLDERNMTLDSRGTVYFTGGLGNVTAGIVAFGLPKGDINFDGQVNLTDFVLALCRFRIGWAYFA